MSGIKANIQLRLSIYQSICLLNILIFYRVVAGTIYDILGNNTVSGAAQRRRDMLVSEGNNLADAWGAPPVVRAFVGVSDSAAAGCDSIQSATPLAPSDAKLDADLIQLFEQVR